MVVSSRIGPPPLKEKTSWLFMCVFPFQHDENSGALKERHTLWLLLLKPCFPPVNFKGNLSLLD